MHAKLLRFGERQSPVVVIDDISGAYGEIVEIAARLAPFPSSAGTYYPGVRRLIAETDGDADLYVERIMQAAAPFIGGAFDFTQFDLIEASFSIVTAPPGELGPLQRAPHFDTVDANQLALLHYLSDIPDTGTAFYRHRATGIEVIDADNVRTFVDAARLQSVGAEGYIRGSNAHFEQIGAVEAIPDRLIIYRSALLHSGIIPPGMTLSANPREGRLTGNFFVRGS